ncbi:hypothetical protein [Boseongicola aestuarii]|uniref:Uncharacterized protein n=1 Tax=Boseongicola aestuarii TaxID=1470561 RepID=A0A238IWR6_9RHOB|nr:hypothetical protein [Boseongicola aestuarii]SMX22422.1 hypothetical protein BOA8489_00518 [Boseongicola aestuarii]
MRPVFQIMPIALLLIGAVIAVWRGIDTKSDRTNNRGKGGGASWKTRK